MSASEGSDIILTEAQYLRDYLVRTGAKSGPKLAEAVAPFERSTERGTDEQAEQRLLVTYQAAYEEVRATVDDYTLDEILRGRSPYRPAGWAAILGSSALTAFGIVLVAMAIFFSYWSNQSASTLAKVDDFSSFEHFEKVMRLVEFETFFEKNFPDPPPEGFEPLLLYLEGISDLGIHYRDEQELPARMGELIRNDDPLVYVVGGAKDVLCRNATEASWLAGRICPVSPDWLNSIPTQSVDAEVTEAAGGADRAAALLQSVKDGGAAANPFRTSVEGLLSRRSDTMLYAGREAMLFDYPDSRYTISSYAEILSDKVHNVQRWWFPVIYGLLGSVVYCMWRILNPRIAPLGPLYTVMRTAFAGLAALTLSMLLIPSNALALGTDASRPLVYLIAFIFGYSVEAFVATLNNLNMLIAETMSPKKRSSGK